MKHSIIFALLILTITACGNSPQPTIESDQPTSPTARASTPEPSSTATPTPTFTPSPTAFPWPEQTMNSENASIITELHHWGLGAVRGFTKVADGNLLVYTSIREYLYSPDYALISKFAGTQRSLLTENLDLFIQAATDGSIIVWSLKDGQPFVTIDRTDLDEIVGLFLFPDGSKLGVGVADSSIEIYNTADWVHEKTLFHPDIAPVPYIFRSTPDQEFLIVSNYDDIGVWNVETNELVSRIPNAGQLFPKAVSADGGHLLTFDYPNVVVVWGLPAMDVVQSIRTGLDYVYSAQFDTSGENIIVNPDMVNHTAEQIRRISDGLSITSEQAGIDLATELSTEAPQISEEEMGEISSRLQEMGHLNDLFQLRMAPAEEFYLTASIGEQEFQYTFPTFYAEELTNSGSLSSDKLARIYCVEEQLVIHEIETNTDTLLGECNIRPADVSFAANLLAAIDGPNVELLDLASGQVVSTLRWHQDDVFRAIFSPNGLSLITLADDAAVWTLDENVSRLFSLDGQVTGSGISFSPDGRFLFSLDGASCYPFTTNRLRMWRLSDGTQLNGVPLDSELDCYEQPRLNSLAISPDGLIAAIGNSFGNIILIDLQSSSVLITLEGHIGNVESVAFSPDGEALISVGADGIVRLWGLP